jgi:hypothetical protein
MVALAVVLVLLGSALAAGQGTGGAKPDRTASERNLDPSPEVQPRSSSPSPAISGACHAAGSVPGASGSDASRIAPDTTGPGPLFNSQVQPFASVTGPYDYVAAGAALRDQGYGSIQLSWPGSATLVGAYMIWAMLDYSVPPSNGTLNGHNVSGTWTAYATPSPCWAPTYIYTFVADVTTDVVNGNNTLTGFPSGVTNGYNPWNQSQVTPMDEGASLVAIYTHGTAIHQVTVFSGALPVDGSGPITQLNYSTTNVSAVKTTYIVADGQLPGNQAIWNGTVVNGDAFPGNDPKESHSVWSYGNLSDTVTFTNLTVPVGSNNTTAEVSTTQSDCVTWVGQVLSVGVAASKGPYTVKFLEQGLPSGTSWSVDTHSTTHLGTAGAAPSPITFSLANGSYTYTIGAVAGFLTSPTTGSYSVAGGPVLIRVFFHAFLYTLTFNETGLPTDDTWWVYLTNSSQSFAQNLTAYSPEGAFLNVTNGSYHFVVGMDGLYLPTPGSGTATVSGSALTRTIPFRPPPLYNVTILEQNLTAGTSWGGTTETNWGTFYNHTTSASFVLQLPNQTGGDALYPYSVTGYTVASGLYFSVNGAPRTVDVNYSRVYGLRFVETGLPVGAYWDIQLSGTAYSGYSDTNNNTNYFSVPNGTYTFYVEPIYAYVANVSSGPCQVQGQNVTVPLTFSPAPTYAVNFTESGLAPGTNWSVVLGLPNATQLTKSSVGTVITFEIPNGSYSGTPAAVGYETSPSTDYFSVSGANQTIPVPFIRVYSVRFIESGLPTGTYWYLYLASYFGYSYSSTIVFEEQNGSYAFAAEPTDGFEPSPTGGTVVVAGLNVVENLTYTNPAEPTYTMGFTESGLPTGTNWSVEAVDIALWSTGTVIDFTEPNGSYDFYVPNAAGAVANPSSGSVVIDGANSTQPIQFGAPSGSYNVTFVESALPDGSTWFVNITGEPSLSATVDGSAGTSVTIFLPNASYSYSAATVARGWSGPSGEFQVHGVNELLSVPFFHAGSKSLVTFTETGLPSGATWYVNITGQTSLSATVLGGSGTTVTIDLANGTYSFAVATGASGYSSSSGGSFTVSGKALGEPVVFTFATTATYTVTFSESGLPNGATWYVNITGQSPLLATVAAGGGTQLTITLANGTYPFTAQTNWKNWTTGSGRSATVDGKPATVAVTFGSSSPSTSGAPLPFLWIGLALLLLVLAFLFILFAAKRRKKKEQPDAAVAGSDSTGTTGGAPPPPPPPPPGAS